MRSTTAFVLATLAIGQAAAGHLKHASFHSRRQKEVAQDKVDIDVVKRTNYDVKNVDWTQALKDVNWSSVFSASSSTPVPPPAPTPSAVQEVKEFAVTTSSTTPAYTPPASSSAAAATSQAVENTGELLSAAGKALLSKLGASVGLNPTSEGAVFIGPGGAFESKVTNNAGSDIIWTCFTAAGMWINANIPLITLSIPAGSTKTVSFSSTFSGGCAAIYPDTILKDGLIYNTLFEFTGAGLYTTYDVSREVNMKGNDMYVKGKTCVSDMNTCVFKCNDPSAESCITGYSIHNCDAATGGGVGHDSTGAASGGCTDLGASGTLTINLS